MKFGIFGDIHGNADALKAVLEFYDKKGIETLLCTGDVVGYGAQPRECIQLVRDRCIVCVAGNHDHAACGRLDTEFFNVYAKRIVDWTRSQLTGNDLNWLANRPFINEFEDFTLTHGSAHNPEVFNYITTIFDAELSFECLQKPILFYGHTHIPLAFFDTTPMTCTLEARIKINTSGKTLVNVGSVGQPRDGHPTASLAIYDSEVGVVERHRVAFDKEAAKRRMLESGMYEYPKGEGSNPDDNDNDEMEGFSPSLVPRPKKPPELPGHAEPDREEYEKR